MKVGVLGTGDVGRVLGSAMISLGHEVKLGSRDADNPKVRAWAKENGRGPPPARSKMLQDR